MKPDQNSREREKEQKNERKNKRTKELMLLFILKNYEIMK